MSDLRWAIPVGATALLLVAVGVVVPDRLYGTDEADVDWPAFTAQYETQSPSGTGLATNTFRVDYRSIHEWTVTNLTARSGQQFRNGRVTLWETAPNGQRMEFEQQQFEELSPSSWLSPVVYTDVAIATRRYTTRRELADGTIEIVQTAPRDDVTTTRLGPRRFPLEVSERNGGQLVFHVRFTNVDWQ